MYLIYDNSFRNGFIIKVLINCFKVVLDNDDINVSKYIFKLRYF